ncbi:MAG: YggS family pyridoxal phosphate-dependent enzyme, partial [Desulfobacterales bacterium]|nr:YggS family pyridoxal phosphate-dependent enzyme [Desulfobacterales bacterium]
KKAIVGDSLQLHFIGHLQSNKARTAAEIFAMIETVDRYKIGAALNKHLEALGRKLDILVQVNVGLESVKSGVLPHKTEELLMQLKDLENLRLKGLMTMPPFTEDPEEARPYFRKLRLLGEEMQGKGLLAPDENFELSMGMSNDYHIAIEEGATLIRIGTAIFGNRPAK